MANARLMWSLETQGLLSEIQCGLRKHYSALDHLLRIETFIKDAFVKRGTRSNHTLWSGKSL